MTTSALPIAINVAPYDARTTGRIENLPGARHALGTAEMSWYDRVRALGYGTKSVQAFTDAFGPPQLRKRYEDLMSVWTFQQGETVVWALVSPRGVYWEGPLHAPEAEPHTAQAVALAIEVMETSLRALTARPALVTTLSAPRPAR